VDLEIEDLKRSLDLLHLLFHISELVVGLKTAGSRLFID